MAYAADRPLGKYPLSISTSLALEGALGIHPDRPVGRTSLSDYQELWVNIKTLFRNFYNAIGKDSIARITQDDLYSAFVQEAISITEVVESESDKKTRVVLYNNDYKGLLSKHPKAILRVNTTENQILYTKTMTWVLQKFIKEYRASIKLFDKEITGIAGTKCLVLSHYPIDLFAKGARSIALLESHTGVIKDKSLWYTKYYNGKDLPSIPFREDLLVIFGDTDMFRPLPAAMRKALVELSIKYKWSYVTTKEKILYGVNSLQDKYLAELIKSIIRY